MDIVDIVDKHALLLFISPKNLILSYRRIPIRMVDNWFFCPQTLLWLGVDNIVDIVDNSLFHHIFSHFYNVSGSHGYQQFAVYTVFK